MTAPRISIDSVGATSLFATKSKFCFEVNGTSSLSFWVKSHWLKSQPLLFRLKTVRGSDAVLAYIKSSSKSDPAEWAKCIEPSAPTINIEKKWHLRSSGLGRIPAQSSRDSRTSV